MKNSTLYCLVFFLIDGSFLLRRSPNLLASAYTYTHRHTRISTDNWVTTSYYFACERRKYLALSSSSSLSTAAGSVDLQQQQEPLAVKDARNIIQSRLSKAEEAENRGDANPDKRPFDVVLAQGNPILIKATIQNRRKHGRDVAFLDLLGDVTPDNKDPTYLQALVTTKDLAQCNGVESEDSAALFKTCYQLASRGAQVAVRARAGRTGNNGEACAVVEGLALLACAPEPWAVKQVLRLAKEENMFKPKDIHKTLGISEEHFAQLLVTGGNDLHKETISIAKQLRLQNPPPEKYSRNTASQEEETEWLETKRLAHLPFFKQTEEEVQAWNVTRVARCSELVPAWQADAEPADRLYTVEALVQSRRRIGGRLAFLNLKEEEEAEKGGGGDGGREGRSVALVRAALLADVVFPPPSPGGGGGGGGAGPSSSPFRTLADLCRSGSRVRLTGFLLRPPGGGGGGGGAGGAPQPPVLAVTAAVLVRSAWQPAAVLAAAAAAAHGAIGAAEAAAALGLAGETWKQDLEALQTGPQTERWWAAVELSHALQDAQSQQGRLTEAQEAVLRRYDAARGAAEARGEAFLRPLLREAGEGAAPHEGGGGGGGPAAPLKSGRDGSWWQRKKAPQIAWMVRRAGERLRAHPAWRARPLRVVDIGGGSGELAMALAAEFGEDVRVEVIDINYRGDKVAGALAKRGLGAHLVTGRCADATRVVLPPPGAPGAPDLFVGLHACGVLSDVILQHAIEAKTSFILCTCCFCSNQGLRIRGETQAEWLGLKESTAAAARSAAEVQGNAAAARRAMGTLNLLRARAVRRRWALPPPPPPPGEEEEEAGAAAAATTAAGPLAPPGRSGPEACPPLREVHLVAFPAAYSLRNLVLVGAVDHRRRPSSSSSALLPAAPPSASPPA